MKLSIIIVNYNVKFFIEQCLNSILASDLDFNYEIFVVDNNSTDGSVDYIQSKFNQPFIHLVANLENVGFARANNQAIQKARGKYILLLNPDTLLGEHVLKNASDFMDRTPNAGGVGVKMINGQGVFLPESKRGFPSPWVSFCKMSGLGLLFPKSPVFGQYYLRYLDEDKIHKVPILAGAFMMLRHEALDKIGLLDESFFMYGEDIDLSYRIVKGGYQNYYLPDTIIHYKGESTDRENAQAQKAFYEAMRIFFEKYFVSYSKLYSWIIQFGIHLSAFWGGFFKRRNKKSTCDLEAKYTVITFNKDDDDYNRIIEKMDDNKIKNVQFRIYTPKTNMIIGTGFTKSKTDDTIKK
ncbi:MAG: hypothetical protein RL662_2404 [Bacteroidota bacterium]|jgi:GT2 family glycosyltransferase